METINERAKAYATQHPKDEFDDYGNGLDAGKKIGYIKGAQDQLAIDIEKACDWIMRTPMYAKQPSTLVDEFLRFMGK